MFTKCFAFCYLKLHTDVIHRFSLFHRESTYWYFQGLPATPLVQPNLDSATLYQSASITLTIRILPLSAIFIAHKLGFKDWSSSFLNKYHYLFNSHIHKYPCFVWLLTLFILSHKVALCLHWVIKCYIYFQRTIQSFLTFYK